MIQKDDETAKNALIQLKKNRMLVISKVPQIAELRKKHFEAAQKLNITH